MTAKIMWQRTPSVLLKRLHQIVVVLRVRHAFFSLDIFVATSDIKDRGIKNDVEVTLAIVVANKSVRNHALAVRFRSSL